MSKDRAPMMKTPIGRLSFPSIIEANTKGQYPTNKWQTDFFISFEDAAKNDDWQKLVDAVKKVASANSDDEIKLPLIDVNTLSDERKIKLPEEVRKNHFMLRARSIFCPLILGVDAKQLPVEEGKKIKGGDYAMLGVQPFYYKQQGGGVSLGLQVVQFVKSGKAFSQAKEKMIQLFDEVEITPEDMMKMATQ